MLLIIFILLASIKISTTHGSDFLRTCIPSTCGSQKISNPFNCGDQDYQLSCNGNKTYLGAPYDKYLVTNINYDTYTINIVNTELASGKCNLPSQAITPSFFPNGFRLPNRIQKMVTNMNYDAWVTTNMNYDEWVTTNIYEWVTFINCSEKNPFPSDYNPNVYGIPCLSQNNRFIYVVDGSYINSLANSCSYLTMVPIIPVDFANIGDNSFQLLKDGFSISWGVQKIKRSKIFDGCLRKAVQQARYPMEEATNKVERIKYPFQIFVHCIQKSQDFALYRYFIAFVVFLNIITFYLGNYFTIMLNNKKSMSSCLLVIITLGRFIIAPLCIHVFLLYELLKMLSPIDYIEIFLRNQQQTTLTRYAYTDIVAMTRHFKDQLGQGGFGTVYKGELPGDYLVAVKLLGKSNDNGEDFISEVSTIGTIHHTNVVRLVGFCSEGLHRALVYEYMYNGSLDKYIFSSTQKFTTKKLNEIALGVARGIDYLHRGCDMRILHFDIKPHNILLDSNFNPKVSDFGLAKLYSKDNSLVSTFAARGTIGYMAPELISRSFGLISYKSDVYSFGMLLLEMAGGRRNYDSRVENSSQAYYPSWIYDRLNQQTNLEVLDHEVEIVDVEKKLCKIGLWCIQMSPTSRPTMNRVVEMLEDDAHNVEMPPKPFFFSSSQQTTREQNSYDMSFNEISTIYESE